MTKRTWRRIDAALKAKIALEALRAKMRTDELVAFASRSDDYAGFRSRAGDAGRR